MTHNDSFTRQHHQVLALAGLLQSCQQVSLIARQGRWNEPAASTCIYSLFQLNADSVIDVYEGINGLRSGIGFLRNLLQKQVERADMEITRYALTLLHLERKVIQQEEILGTISQDLDDINNEFDIHDVANTVLLQRIADIYVNTISTIPPKVQVEGNREYLTQTINTYRVRAMLFAGIRSAVLWRQLGGSRWGLFFGRRRILDRTLELLKI